MKKKTRPVIKWTGGKYNEFALFADKIPGFSRYIEPFFGGGGVFFALQPQRESFLNDKSAGLINFYREIKNPELQRELLNYALAWEELTLLSGELWQQLKPQYLSFVEGKSDEQTLAELIRDSLAAALDNYTRLQETALLPEPGKFRAALAVSMTGKARRIQQICTREKRIFNEGELADHFETGIKGGFYLLMRSLLNAHYAGRITLNQSKAAANWYFVREFCYGSMFRFNAKGEFNIPYGGITYNKKNFRQKVVNIFSAEMADLFRFANFSNLDFEEFLNALDLSSGDFIFLDPPYDSEFSAYDQSAFTAQDQLRLAELLFTLNAKWMVVIKETDLIRKLYTRPGIHISTFYKNYTYNVRGRNNREVNHLIITNYIQS